ncbi:thrombomodulin [Sceloporus undulatus]|uniref:thrombomodulin n=1 Tax=Sceloporus undulatus TaxID=8520 RepID=UPI001C4C0662|nr:thrombomodulin [Sceloporus undulatus]
MEGSIRARLCSHWGSDPLVVLPPAMWLLRLCLFALTGAGPLAGPTPRGPTTPGPSPSAFAQCLEGACFALFWAPRTFPEASLECQANGGHLMSVRSTVAAEAIALLFQRGSAAGRAWLGLRLPEGSCREAGKRLRGFQWVSGEERSDYAAWADSVGAEEDPLCGGAPLCVVVTPGLLWEEQRCQSPAEGFLCEYSYPGGTCGPLNPGPAASEQEEEEEMLVVYRTPFGARESDLLALPPGSSALLPNLGLSLECRPQPEGSPKWASASRGAWDCRLENGGCQGHCHSGGEQGQPYCSCPEGSALLEEDRRGCGSPCALLGCEHHCVPEGPSSSSASCMCWEGFALAEDGRRCLDVDDCQAEPGPCEQECLNTEGGFRCLCFPGFEEVEGKCQAVPNWGCFDLGCQQDCAVVGGSPRCLCFEGYAPDPEKPQQCLMVCNQSQCPPRCDPHTGHDCHCPNGFILDVRDDDSKVCEDISECDSGYCGELECVNTPGSYYCLCPNGHFVQDAKLCEEPEGDIEGSGEIDLDPRSPVATLVPPKEGSRRGMLVGTIVSATLMGVVLVAILGYLVKKHRSAQSRKGGTCQQPESGVVLQHVSSNSASPGLKM